MYGKCGPKGWLMYVTIQMVVWWSLRTLKRVEVAKWPLRRRGLTQLSINHSKTQCVVVKPIPINDFICTPKNQNNILSVSTRLYHAVNHSLINFPYIGFTISLETVKWFLRFDLSYWFFVISQTISPPWSFCTYNIFLQSETLRSHYVEVNTSNETCHRGIRLLQTAPESEKNEIQKLLKNVYVKTLSQYGNTIATQNTSKLTEVVSIFYLR